MIFFYTEQISFPEFCKTRYIPKVHLRTFSSATSRYDFIRGQVFSRHGFILNHARHCITWDGLTIPMPNDTGTNDNIEHTVTHRSAKIYAAGTGTLKIKIAKYDKVDPQIVPSQCNHLLSSQKLQLGKLLAKFPGLFSGKLGRCNNPNSHSNYKILQQLQSSASHILSLKLTLQFSNRNWITSYIKVSLQSI